MTEIVDVFESVFDQIDAFIYRCKNDSDYTMEYIAGNVMALCGYSQHDLLQNKTVAWTAITHPDDVDRAFTIVDAALERREPWDMEYRVMCKGGSSTWVRERGSGVFVGDDLAYL